MPRPLGRLTQFSELAADEQELVRLAWKGAETSANYRLCFQSNFPVGCAILAANDAGETKTVIGSNVENKFISATICAERTAVTACGASAFTNLLKVAVVCAKIPGGSPCGLCRQVLVQFGADATLLCVVDHESNVRRSTVKELLPAATGETTSFNDLNNKRKEQVRRLEKLKERAHVPYTKRARAALFNASNGGGARQAFAGISDENASFGGTAQAECVAMRNARTEGFDKDVELMVTVENLTEANPIDGECLQVLREFGVDSAVILVDPNGSTLETTLDQVLPDSFGPEAL